MPLTESVNFKAELQKGNRIQVPKLIRWQYKMEPNQVLRVRIKTEGYSEEEFYGRMSKDGRLSIPKLALELLQEEDERLVGYVLNVSLEPC